MIRERIAGLVRWCRDFAASFGSPLPADEKGTEVEERSSRLIISQDDDWRPALTAVGRGRGLGVEVGEDVPSTLTRVRDAFETMGAEQVERNVHVLLDHCAVAAESDAHEVFQRQIERLETRVKELLSEHVDALAGVLDRTGSGCGETPERRAVACDLNEATKRWLPERVQQGKSFNSETVFPPSWGIIWTEYAAAQFASGALKRLDEISGLLVEGPGPEPLRDFVVRLKKGIPKEPLSTGHPR